MRSDDPRAAAALRAPLEAEEQEVHDLRIVLVHRTKTSGLRMAAGMDHVVEPFDDLVTGAEAGPDLGRVWLTAEVTPDTPLRLHEVPVLRVVEPALDPVRARPGRRGGGVGQAHRLGRPRAVPARVPRPLLDPGRRRDRGRRRAAAGGSLRALSHAAGRRAGRAARDRRQGPDRPRLRRPRVLGHRELRAAGAHLHPPGRGRRRAGLAPRHARPRDGASASAAPGGRRVPVADDPRAGVLRVLARRAPPRSTSTATSPTRSSATCTRPATRPSRPARGSSCWSTPLACGARSAITTTPARSTSTASPAPTSTRPWSTTTSTRT